MSIGSVDLLTDVISSMHLNAFVPFTARYFRDDKYHGTFNLFATARSQFFGIDLADELQLCMNQIQ